MIKRKIDKKERKLLLTLVFSILAFSFLSQPIKNIIDVGIPNNLMRIIIGLGIILGILWFLKVR